MAETDLTATEANALHGTTDSDTDFTYHSPGDAEYFTEGQRQRQRLLTLVKALGNRFRVYKDGTNTYGVRPGKIENGDSTLSYAGSTGNSLTDNQTNYIWLYIQSGALTLDTSTSDFPDPSSTPHIPLATIAVASGSYDYTDITDYRQLACFSLSSAATAANLNTLVGGSTADALHTHDAAGLASGLQDLIPQISFSGTDDEDGTGTMDIQVQDAAGNNLAERFLVRTWIADADFSEPDPQTDYSVTVGEQMREIEANADYEVISNASGLVTMSIDAGGAKTVYVMAELDGRIYSQSLAITA
jgi:hypothetical protein